MKKISRFSLASALIATGLLAGAPAFAADTANISVSATVTGACKFNSGGSLSFTLDPTSGADAAPTAKTDPKFWCTNGASYTVSDNSGLHASSGVRRMRHASDTTKFIPYALSYTTTGTGSGKNTEITLALTSSIANADFVDAPAGSYTDTVQLSITP